LTFSGTAGQKVSLLGSNATMACDLWIKNPDGSTLTSGGAPWLDTKTLPVTGTYTVIVDSTGTAVGSISLRLYDVVDISGSITPGGAPVTVTTTTPGQNARLYFSGTAGQRISLLPSNGFGASIIKPDGSILTNQGGFVDVRTLPVTGTYNLFVDPYLDSIVSGTLTLYDVPADASGTVTIGGASAPVTITVPGQNGTVTFAGTAGQVVTIHLTGSTMSTATTLRLFKPDGTQLGTIYGGGNFNLANQTLPVTGTYSILIDPSGTGTGSANINVTSP